MLTCEQVHRMMHQYLDGDLPEAEQVLLRRHLQTCTTCEAHLRQLEKTIALVRSIPQPRVSEDFTERLMQQLPQPKRKRNWQSRFKQHPILAAAAIFFLLMAGSTFGTWYERDPQFQVTTDNMANLELLEVDKENHIIRIPAGTKLNGNILVQNGTVEVEGEVAGDVVVIDGKMVLASTASITGNAEQIDQIFEWVWYHMKNTWKKVF
ncbi:zf-HC2 domain-containing protein [Rubeoparvulum massiliense]|uniref:zf-HC2 domain-containing protein n=1 Tax=Rubeoparvulum massiliense TaxID=1631346 RepID=UPI00065E94C6|nr:zf-HC2 domain-containing protein [Rubeoparvulum massiliense]